MSINLLTKHERKNLTPTEHSITSGLQKPTQIKVVEPEHHYPKLKNPRLLPENSKGEYK